ncbi:MAG: hypothetical protein A3C53_00255 [Omnitrophica WOR_2 bacterium RIFCSPHIGHO2_02_FULL_68_15]|nr:MAG: hypothetical protein A3C53_00255 [Omnitrophica WOR_2 bacterium RIFCSPHIGHO2_02_FULL_68_15]
MIKRPQLLDTVRAAVRRSRVVGLLGPRQCGKTTLARQLVDPRSPNYFDLEDPDSVARLEQPMVALRELKGLVVIDEVQLRPELFPVLRVLADRSPVPARFLLLGSAAPALLRQSSESLAGRMQLVTMSGFGLQELGLARHPRHWLRGGFPRAFLAETDAACVSWRQDFITMFLQRDLPQFGVSIAATAMQRFWTMVAHYHGQVWNAAEPARSLGISETSVRRYLDLLTDVFMIRQLQPWHANVSKRQVKAPKVYFRDTGLLHQLLGIRSARDLLTHPKCGASWEGYVIEETLKAAAPDEAYFWATHGGAEVDLVLRKGRRWLGVECKRVDAPRLTSSMRQALRDLKLERLAVLYPGTRRYRLADAVEAVPLAAVPEGLTGLFPR